MALRWLKERAMDLSPDLDQHPLLSRTRGAAR
jgi:hypothetical protein